MYRVTTTVFLLCCLSIKPSYSGLFSADKLRMYTKLLNLDKLSINEMGNELWHGLFRDCNRKVTFSCIQKNAYTYLDNAFIERDNITVFDGLILTRNTNVTYDTCPKVTENRNDVLRENLVVDEVEDAEDCEKKTNDDDDEAEGRKFREPESPLEEVTNALRRKTVKFLSTRNYELQLPEFFFEGATVRINPREIDENGALLRVDFSTRDVQEGRILFKKIKKFLQNKLLTAFLALLLIIKLIKVKFLFIIPFLFGVGAAKKLFLKLLLFFIPAFAHIFKLCSSYYSNHAKFHHHHHQVAHHHHHVPVPVPVPAFYHRHHDDDFDSYGYDHPHIQYRKDMEELKEWGIESYGDEPYEEPSQLVNRVVSPSIASSGPYGLPQYAPNVKPIASSYLDAGAVGAHSLAYSGYVNSVNRRPGAQSAAVNVLKTPVKKPYAVFATNPRPSHPQRLMTQPVASAKSSTVLISQPETMDDDYYGPIIDRLEAIFGQLNFHDETCRELLVCSMYKSPASYSPHSNIVSNELSRDPEELKLVSDVTESSKKFFRYLNAARLGQEGGDCLRTYPCRSNE